MWDFTSDSEGKEPACHAGGQGSTPGSGRSPGERNGNPTPVSLPGKSHQQRSLGGYNPCSCNSLT